MSNLVAKVSKSVAKVLSKVTKVLWLVAKAYGLLLWCYGQMLKYDIHAHRPAQLNEISTPGAALTQKSRDQTKVCVSIDFSNDSGPFGAKSFLELMLTFITQYHNISLIFFLFIFACIIGVNAK